MDSIEGLRNKALNDVVDALIVSLENKMIKEKDIGPVAEFVLANIGAVSNEVKMGGFLNKLSEKWPIFSHMVSLYEREAQKRAESEIASGVLTLAQHGKIDDAVSLAKTATMKS